MTYEIGDRVSYGYGQRDNGVVKATSGDWLWVKFDNGGYSSAGYSSVRADDAALREETVEAGSVWEGSYGKVKVRAVEGVWVIYHAYEVVPDATSVVFAFAAKTKAQFLAAYRSVTDVH